MYEMYFPGYLLIFGSIGDSLLSTQKYRTGSMKPIRPLTVYIGSILPCTYMSAFTQFYPLNIDLSDYFHEIDRNCIQGCILPGIYTWVFAYRIHAEYQDICCFHTINMLTVRIDEMPVFICPHFHLLNVRTYRVSVFNPLPIFGYQIVYTRNSEISHCIQDTDLLTVPRIWDARYLLLLLNSNRVIIRAFLSGTT